MSYVLQILAVSFIAIFVENAVFARAMGASTLIVISRNRRNLLGFGCCVIYFTAVTGFLCYFIDKWIAWNENNYIYAPVVYVMILGLVYVITLLCLWKFTYKFFVRMRKYIHISAFNCAIIGAMFLNSSYCITLAEYIFYGVGMGIGFVFAVYMVSVVYDRLYSLDVPYLFRGYPLLLVYIGILSMAFFGLTGYQLSY